jgi:phi13 family phage major tail protein
MPEKNKVKFNLKNVHAAEVSFSESGDVSFGTPRPIPGAVSLSMDPNGEQTVFYADGVAYYVSNDNQGYNGDLEMALLPDWFRTYALGDTLDSNGVLVENANAELGHYALLFQFDGDKRGIRHVLYNCTASRPKIEGKTNEDKREVQTETMTINAAPLPNGIVKAKTGDSTSDAAYNSWYNSVYVAEAQVDVAELSALSIGALTLTPSFDADTTAYTAATSNASDTVTATGSDEDTIVVLTVNGSAHTSGESATWQTGTNTVRVVAIKGEATRTYTVTVTKEE